MGVSGQKEREPACQNRKDQRGTGGKFGGKSSKMLKIPLFLGAVLTLSSASLAI
jgi:hypothetical protein